MSPYKKFDNFIKYINSKFILKYIMGIFNFHNFIRKKYPESIIRINYQNIYDYIFIDVNYIMHACLNSWVSESEFISKLFLKFDFLFSNFLARKQIFFAMDGTPNLAKIIIQRERRANSKNINSLWLTPGTITISNIENSIKKYLDKLKLKLKYINPEIIFCNSEIPGEGEIKIFNQLNKINNKNNSNLIIGNDADLVILSMASQFENINILIKNNQILSIPELIQAHKKLLNTNQDIKSDFVILSLFMGNDYFPKIYYMVFERIWNSYLNIFKLYNSPLISNGKFNKNILVNFFSDICYNLPIRFKKTDFLVNHNKYIKNYLEGILWCLNFYQTGFCPKYEYYYFGPSIHPNKILLYILLNPDFDLLDIPKSETKPIPTEIHPLIILPKSAMSLIPDKYHDIIQKKLDFLYEPKICKVCEKLKNNPKKLKYHKEIGHAPGINMDQINKITGIINLFINKK